MIVDVHTHVGESEHYSGEFVADLEASWDEVKWSATSLEDHWQAAASVDRAIVLAVDAPAAGFVVPNEYVSAYVADHPDKLIGFASVDPNRPDAVELLDRAVGELGLRGLKLGPIYQRFDPLGDEAAAVWGHAQQLGLPVICHQGTTFLRQGPLELAQPVTLDAVARRFPDLILVIAHLGHPWCEETMAVIRKHPHLYADISALHTRPYQLYRALVAAEEYRVFGKLLFGSDFPFGTLETTLAGLEHARRIPEGTSLPKISAAAIDEIVHRPSLELLGLEGDR